MPRFAVILPAAGSSSRFGAPKLVQDLAGVPVIARAVLPFIQRADTHQVLIAVPNDPFATATPGQQNLARLDDPVPSGRANQIWEALSREPAVKNRLGGQIALVPGGPTRAESVWAALKRVPADVEWVAIHDAARPLLSQDVIDRTLAAAVEYGAAAPAIAVQWTIKQAVGPLPTKVEKTVPRDALWALQTPQIMRRETLLRAFAECVYPMQHITDDLQLLELAGEQAWLVPGDERNIKITTVQDLLLAEMLLRSRTL
ncbi:MAG: 2-C-methyl-D-erythritol 4-phosphate cytidylyltransferase [Humisphaera sp.]|nr:2-C-methyl-D-erythritol 4-phosphate cytidylyltransferase [Humisphaera sp.]